MIKHVHACGTFLSLTMILVQRVLRMKKEVEKLTKCTNLRNWQQCIMVSFQGLESNFFQILKIRYKILKKNASNTHQEGIKFRVSKRVGKFIYLMAILHLHVVESPHHPTTFYAWAKFYGWMCLLTFMHMSLGEYKPPTKFYTLQAKFYAGIRFNA